MSSANAVSRKHFEVRAGPLTVTLDFEPLPLRLRHVFGTSHSSSSTRTNALFTVAVAVSEVSSASLLAVGQGESGLPPKKPLCYHADVADCADFFDAFCSAIREMGDDLVRCACDRAGGPFAGLDGFFSAARREILPDGCQPLLAGLLHVMDGLVEKRFLAGRSGLESAVLGCWSSLLRLPFFVFAGIPAPAAPSRSFYTAALNDDIGEMVASTQFGLGFTPCIKIKLDGDVRRSERILEHFATSGLGRVWSIDANSSWDVACAMAHLPAIRRAAEQVGVYMVEQPFPVGYRPGLDPVADSEWQEFRLALNNIAGRVLLYADESISNEEDVRLFSAVVDGVNIKLEKAGGIRASMRAVLAARRRGLRVWIGTMVSSCLGCTASAHVAYLADDSDVDGGLLVHPDVFDGGFEWRKVDGGIILRGYEEALAGAKDFPSATWGFGVTRVPSQGEGEERHFIG